MNGARSMRQFGIAPYLDFGRLLKFLKSAKNYHLLIGVNSSFNFLDNPNPKDHSSNIDHLNNNQKGPYRKLTNSKALPMICTLRKSGVCILFLRVYSSQLYNINTFKTLMILKTTRKSNVCFPRSHEVGWGDQRYRWWLILIIWCATCMSDCTRNKDLGTSFRHRINDWIR